MPYSVGTYNVEVTGAYWAQSGKGTAGLYLDLSHPEAGWIGYTIWLSRASKDLARRQFRALGVDHLLTTAEDVAQIPAKVVGMKCDIAVEEDTYYDTPRIRVRSILTGPAEAQIDFKEVAALFSGEAPEAPLRGLDEIPPDDDIPF